MVPALSVTTLLRHKHPLKLAIARCLKITGISPLFFIRRDGFTLRFYRTNLSEGLWADSTYRSQDEEFFRRYLRPGDTVIDVGANVGHLTLSASVAVGPAGVVHAVEPHPRIFLYLAGNVALNSAKNVVLHNVALGKGEESVFFTDNRKSDDANSVSVAGLANCVEVPLLQLDDLPVGRTVVDLLKIDVEGYEKFVLDGASSILSSVRCIYFEFCERHLAKYGCHGRDLLETLEVAGLRLFRSSGENVYTEIRSDYTTRGIEDLVALQDQQEFVQRTRCVIV